MKTLLIGAVVVVCWPVEAQSLECHLPLAQTHSASGTKIYASTEGARIIYYRSDGDVNTDGAPRSYHPNDPRGKIRAYNSIVNAIDAATDADGEIVNCSPRKGNCFARFIKAFEAARDADFPTSGAPSVNFRGMIEMHEGGPRSGKPCIEKSGLNAGYFISQTSVHTRPYVADCRQDKYLDATRFNANVLPRRTVWRSQGIRSDGYDLVVFRDPTTGAIAIGINGDKGPEEKTGEASIAALAALQGVEFPPNGTYDEARSLAVNDLQYLIFPDRDAKKELGLPLTQEQIEAWGSSIFEEWGGADRLAACAALPQ